MGGLLTAIAEALPVAVAFCRSLLPHALKLGLTTQARSHALITELEAIGARNQGWGRWPLLLSAWKQKPASAQ